MNTVIAILTKGSAAFAELPAILQAVVAGGGDQAALAQKILDELNANPVMPLADLGKAIIDELGNLEHGQIDGATHAGDGAP